MTINCWNAVCGESRTYGVEWGKAGDNIKRLPITIGKMLISGVAADKDVSRISLVGVKR